MFELQDVFSFVAVLISLGSLVIAIKAHRTSHVSAVSDLKLKYFAELQKASLCHSQIAVVLSESQAEILRGKEVARQLASSDGIASSFAIELAESTERMNIQIQDSINSMASIAEKTESLWEPKRMDDYIVGQIHMIAANAQVELENVKRRKSELSKTVDQIAAKVNSGKKS